MEGPTLHRFTRPAAVIMMAEALLASACGSSKSDDNSSSSGNAESSSVKGLDIAYAKLSETLNGSGSSFQAPFQEAMIAAFQQQASKVTINYGAGGSGKGKTDLRDQVVDFAGTDSLVSSADKANAKGGDILYVPMVAAPIT